MIAGDGACIPDGGVHAPLLCLNAIPERCARMPYPDAPPEKLGVLDRVLAFQQGCGCGCRGFKTKCYVCTECNIVAVSSKRFERRTRHCSISHS